MKLKSLFKPLYTAVLVLAGLSFSACENSNEVGTDLVTDEVSIVSDSTFTVVGKSTRSEAVVSRTVMQLLGSVDAPGYGSITSDFVTQFMPSSSMVTTDVTPETIDSLKLEMLVNTSSFVGDSLALMGLEVYPLAKQLEVPIYSNFNPQGYYDPNNCVGSLVYNLTKGAEADSLQKNTYYTLSVKLPVEMGRDFFRKYKESPQTFASPTEFAKYFPGLYVRNSYGSGRITRVGNTTMKLFYHQNFVNDKGNDTTVYAVGTYFSVTPEIITNNNIALDISPSITKGIADGQVIMLAPVGYDVELTFPAPAIMSSYRTGVAGSLGVVNTLSFQIPVEDIENKYNITAPTDVLLVLKKDRDDFFLKNKLPDDKTSFRATLTKLSDGSMGYAFMDLRQYIMDLLQKDNVTEDDYTFVLMPVIATTESSNDYYGNTNATLTAITPYVTEPKMTKILLEKAKINFVYSKQTTNF